MKNLIYKLAIMLLIANKMYAETDANIFGDVKSEGQHISGVTIYLEGTEFGAITDKTGHFTMINLPEGKYTLVAKMIGYTENKTEVELVKNKTLEVSIELEKQNYDIDEVVVTGTRTEKRKTDSPVIVSSIDNSTMNQISANNVCESLNFQPGLRTEVDCQTCNYTQLRMNGLPGTYSQILINGKQIFSPITGLYGLEQIPSTMVDRIEVVKGGASALYGSSAIGGTVNILTKFPEENNYNISFENSIIDNSANDNLINASLSLVSDRAKEGVTIFASRRIRDEYDANGDDFSELPMIENNSFGATAYFRPEFNHELMLNLSSVYEYRRGGDSFEKAAYLAQQSEERMHNVLSGSVDYKYYFNDFKSSLSIFGGGQNTIRDHYTGIIPDDENSPEYLAHISAPPYGNTENHTLQGGAILNHPVTSNFGIFEITLGSEYVYDDINDEIIAYNYDIDQITKNAAFFTQINWTIFENLIFDIGLRADDHNFVDDIVFNPRLALLYNLNDKMQIRGSFSTGFRAPQVFDTDLHIAFAGGGIQRVAISEDLQEENSQSYSFSINYDNPSEKMIYGFTVEGFYTQLIDAFVLEENSVDGISILEKVNGGNSEVYGITTEARFNYAGDIQFEAGLSLQRSLYDQAVEWSEELPGTKEYLRTPDSYGYMTLIILPERSINGSISAIYTGSMYIPHYGVAGDPGTPENDILFESDSFFQINAKASYQIPQKTIDSDISISLGVKNILDEYQSDFDTGKYRDSGYIYGPAIPRTLFFGISVN